MFINNFDPVAFNLFSLEIRWYSLSYIFGIIFGWLYCKKLIIKNDKLKEIFDDLIFYLIIGIIVGGRLGYILFYNLNYYISNFSEIIMIWKGGMSFHGALVGIIVTVILFSKKHKINVFIFLDLIAISAPIGIFFGRIANFINGELVGKVTNVYWGVIFPNVDSISRHPSQLYEAFLEGIILFIIMNLLYFKSNYKNGHCSLMFLIIYGVFRILSEFFREPDVQIGYIFGYLTMGMTLSLIMIFAGIILYYKK
tara:strand:- start:1143 stop:1901 length:759 start_codon:yes stop_codon:yes gene_type:complete